MHFHSYIKEILDKLIVNGFHVVLIIILMFISLKFVNIITKKIVKVLINKTYDEETEKKIRTFRTIIKSSLDIIIVTVGSMMIIENLGINIGPIIAAAGVVGIAVGFGSQRLVEDIISGILILSSDQIRVGDVIQIGTKSGLVEKLDLKMVVLRDLNGNVHFIRNGKIDSVTNMTKDFSYAVLEIGVAYNSNITYVIDVIKQIAEDVRINGQSADSILEPIEILGLDKFDDSAIIIKARIKTKPIKQWDVGREFNLKLKEKFDELNIEIPFPQRTVSFANIEQIKNSNNSFTIKEE